MNLVKALLSHANHHFAQLPYNLNWGVNSAAVDGLLSQFPLVIFDVGARGRFMPELQSLERFTRLFAFDADEQEVKRLLTQSRGRHREFRAFPYFLGDENRIVDFHVYDNPALSSIFEMDEEFNRAFFVPPVRMERTVQMQSIALDHVVANERLDFPDLLKLDTQGSELAVLHGASRTVRDTLLVETEVEFCAEYTDQPLFADVDRFLRAAGFELLYLNRGMLQRKGDYRGLARGQLVFGDVLYGRSPSTISAMPAERIAKYVVLLCHYGHLDFARHVLNLNDAVARQFPDLERCFRPPAGLLRRGVISQLDKLICLLLHLRKTNQLYTDSDRSWPTR